MTKETMKAVVKNYADTCSRLYTGGEEYFNEIDAKIKGNIDLLLSYIQTAVDETGCKNIVLSGGMFETVFKAIKTLNKRDWSLFKVSGGLRNYKYAFKCPEEFAFMYYGKDFIFIDDSFYSGKTLEHIKTFIESAGGKIVATYVFYDGSKEKRNDVHSLYRYYDFESADNRNETINTDHIEIQKIDSNGNIPLTKQILKQLNLKPGDKVELSVCENDEMEKYLLISKVATKEEEMSENLNLIQNVFNRVVGKNLSVEQVEDICDLLGNLLDCLTEIESEV